jgi:ribosomal protein L11 methyltransferase
MKRKPLWRVSVATTAEAEDAVAELLAGAVGQPPVSYTDVETGEAEVAVYLEKPPACSGNWRADLKEQLGRARACGLKIGSGRVALARVRWEDWAESWKRHFRPINVGSALIVKPSWSRLEPKKGQAVIVLDPGLSFGTGQHPTTAFCLQQLVKCRPRRQPQSLLDIGTGSGILAIAAAKLGYAPVHALDIDPEAVRVARANARQNGVAECIQITRDDLASLSRRPVKKYATICANLLSDLLLAERERILAHLESGGVLVVAGILKREFPEVQAAYEAAGLRLTGTQARREWQSGAFCEKV